MSSEAPGGERPKVTWRYTSNDQGFFYVFSDGRDPVRVPPENIPRTSLGTAVVTLRPPEGFTDGDFESGVSSVPATSSEERPRTGTPAEKKVPSSDDTPVSDEVREESQRNLRRVLEKVDVSPEQKKLFEKRIDDIKTTFEIIALRHEIDHFPEKKRLRARKSASEIESGTDRPIRSTGITRDAETGAEIGGIKAGIEAVLESMKKQNDLLKRLIEKSTSGTSEEAETSPRDRGGAGGGSGGETLRRYKGLGKKKEEAPEMSAEEIEKEEKKLEKLERQIEALVIAAATPGTPTAELRKKRKELNAEAKKLRERKKRREEVAAVPESMKPLLRRLHAFEDASKERLTSVSTVPPVSTPIGVSEALRAAITRKPEKKKRGLWNWIKKLFGLNREDAEKPGAPPAVKALVSRAEALETGAIKPITESSPGAAVVIEKARESIKPLWKRIAIGAATAAGVGLATATLAGASPALPIVAGWALRGAVGSALVVAMQSWAQRSNSPLANWIKRNPVKSSLVSSVGLGLLFGYFPQIAEGTAAVLERTGEAIQQGFQSASESLEPVLQNAHEAAQGAIHNVSERFGAAASAFWDPSSSGGPPISLMHDDSIIAASCGAEISRLEGVVAGMGDKIDDLRAAITASAGDMSIVDQYLGANEVPAGFGEVTTETDIPGTEYGAPGEPGGAPEGIGSDSTGSEDDAFVRKIEETLRDLPSTPEPTAAGELVSEADDVISKAAESSNVLVPEGSQTAQYGLWRYMDLALWDKADSFLSEGMSAVGAVLPENLQQSFNQAVFKTLVENPELKDLLSSTIEIEQIGSKFMSSVQPGDMFSFGKLFASQEFVDRLTETIAHDGDFRSLRLEIADQVGGSVRGSVDRLLNAIGEKASLFVNSR